MNTPKVSVKARVDKNHTSSVSGGMIVTRRAEASARGTSKQEFEEFDMIASGLFGLSTATEEMLTDSPMSVAALIQSGFNEEYLAKLADETLNGTGIGGEYEGILGTNHPATISVFRATANRLKGADVLAMRTRCWKYENAVWIANPDSYVDLAQACIESPNNAGIIMVMKGSWNSPTDPELLLGRPIIFTEFAPTFTAAGGLILANLSQFLEGNYVAPQFAESIHVRFETAERMFRFYSRNAGRSWWRDKLTPKRGVNTLSPFVKLAATTS
jgi:HK97 family phage major capsid protein